MEKLKKLIQKAVFCELQAKDRDKALAELVDGLLSNGKLTDSRAFYKALIEREKLISTGIGMAVALPHARIESANQDFFLAIGLKKGKNGIDWKAIDGLPVRLVFLIGGPKDRQGEYLELLSQVTAFIKDFETKEKLLKSSKLEDVMHLFD